jgi:C4-dicarboxylate transporter DctM subunit
MWTPGQQSNDLEAPMWIVYLAIPLGSGLMCFRFLQVAWSFYRTGELPHHDEPTSRASSRNPRCIRIRRQPAHQRAPAAGRIEPARADPDHLAPILIVACALRDAGLLIVCRRPARVIIFALLIALMLTGMPISIALGLTVLTFLFTMTTCRSKRWR